MSDFHFDGMTPALQTYLDATKGQCPSTKRAELFEAIEPGVFAAYSKAHVEFRCQPGTEDTAKTKTVTSPSGKYTLTVHTHPQGANFWSYTRGVISGGANITICRNYRSFPYLFVEGHPDGNDYLVCGRDYQSQTVVNLTTGETKDYKSPPNFCWAAYTASPSKRTLAVEGCYWGGPYEVILVDFSQPMVSLEILRKEEDDGYTWVEGEPDTAYLNSSGRICLLFGGKEERNLTDEEEDAASDAEDRGEKVWAPKETILWTRPGTIPVSS